MPVRMTQHCKNASAIATFLSDYSKVKRVFYPGLDSHPDHEIAKRLMSGFGGMVSFEIDGGVEAINSFLRNPCLCCGGVFLVFFEAIINSQSVIRSNASKMPISGPNLLAARYKPE